MLNLAIAAYVFPVIFVGELPDKTMVASLVLSTRGRPGAVWLGAAGAFAVHVLIATTAGALAFRLLPARVISGVVAVMFGVGAVMAGREAWRERGPGDGGERRDSDATEAAAIAADAGPDADRPLLRIRTMAAAFGVIFAAEWGDLTQMLTASMTVRYHSALSVGLGALLALWAVAAIAVLGGQRLARLARPRAVRAGTAVLLGGLAAFSAWAALA